MLVHLVEVIVFGWVALATLYGIVTPFLQKGVTFLSCFLCVLRLPFLPFIAFD